MYELVIDLDVLFCTIASKYRLHQCVAMYHSLKSCMAEALLVVLAIDLESEKVLDSLQFPELVVISAAGLEDDELRKLKKERTSSEYCWTLKPVFLLYLYQRFSDIDTLVYLDSDLFFFSNPMQLLRRKDKWSVLLTTHKVNRKANGGFAAFRRSSYAYEAIKWWKNSCLEWCYYHYDNGRFADQGYLDSFKVKFKGVKYLDTPGANAATWNFFRYNFMLKGENIYVDRSRLIFYHFSGLRMKRHASSVIIYGAEAPCMLCKAYSKALRTAIEEIGAVDRKATEYFYLGV
jgi:hypothetical protein